MKKWEYGDTWKVYADDWDDIKMLRATPGLEAAAKYMRNMRIFAEDFIVRDEKLCQKEWFLGAEYVP